MKERRRWVDAIARLDDDERHREIHVLLIYALDLVAHSKLERAVSAALHAFEAVDVV